jgi:flavin reductase (DIM6/NTAB) family NADH-FMN oxidoreductase RutF/rubredoxin
MKVFKLGLGGRIGNGKQIIISIMIDVKSFHKLTYGLYIICSEYKGQKAGYTGNTGFQVTSEPQTIAISCNKNNFTYGIIEKSRKFSLSVLQKDLDTGIIIDFGFKSTRDIDKFSKYKYATGKLGIPVVTESCIASFECNVTNQLDCGTHILFIGEVAAAEKRNDQPALTYEHYHTHYKMLAPKNAPTYIDPEKLMGKRPEPTKPTEAHSEYMCTICGYTYDPKVGEPSMGIPPGTPFEDLPDNFECPVCKAGKDYFREA